jgi:hypothetical protein
VSSELSSTFSTTPERGRDSGGSAEAAVGFEPAAPALDPVRTWIVAHDDSRIFLALYIGLAVVLSLWISLFWLVAVVGAHFALELVRQSHLHGKRSRVVREALWELKLDVALVLFALALSLYMETVLGLVGLQGAARLGAASKAAARFASWERVLRGVVLSADDAAQVARAVVMRRSGATDGETGNAPAASAPEAPSWRQRWTAGTWIAFSLGLACAVLIAVAPWLTDHTTATAATRLLEELRPLP